MLSRALRRGLCHSLPIRAAAAGTHGHGHGGDVTKKDDHHHADEHHDDHHHDDHHHDDHHADQHDVYAEAPVDKDQLSFWNYRPDFHHVTPWLVTHEMSANERTKRGYAKLSTPNIHFGRTYTTDGYHAMFKVPAENIAHGMGAFSYLRIFVYAVLGPCFVMWMLDNEFPKFFLSRMARWYLGLGEYSWTRYHEMAVNEGLIQEDDEPDYFGPFDWYYKAQWKASRATH